MTATVSSAEGSAFQVQVTVTVLDRTVVYRFSMAAGGPYGHGEFSDLSDPQALGLYYVCVLVLILLFCFSFLHTPTFCLSLSQQFPSLSQQFLSLSHLDSLDNFSFFQQSISLSHPYLPTPIPTPNPLSLQLPLHPTPIPKHPLSLTTPPQPPLLQRTVSQQLQLDSHLFAVYLYFIVLPTLFYSSYPLHR